MCTRKYAHTNKRTNENTKKRAYERTDVQTLQTYTLTRAYTYIHKYTHVHQHAPSGRNLVYRPLYPRVPFDLCFFSCISYTKTQIIDSATKYCFLRQFLCQKIGHCFLSHTRGISWTAVLIAVVQKGRSVSSMGSIGIH